jgi:hypothetical protein
MQSELLTSLLNNPQIHKINQCVGLSNIVASKIDTEPQPREDLNTFNISVGWIHLV